MKQMISFLMALAAVFSTWTAHASLTPGWTPALTIKNIIVEDGDAVLMINGGVPIAYLRDDCNSSQLLRLDLTSVDGKAKLALAMTAFTTGQTVQLALQACYSGYPRITHIALGSVS
jgi:hypothetical protein